MEVKDLLEMSRETDFNFDEANNEIKRILKKEEIDGFFLEDNKLNLYQCYGGKSANSGEYWYVIFNDKKDDIDFIVKFKEDAIRFNDKTYKVMVPFHTYKKNNSSKLKNIARRVYSYINKKFKKSILSDKKQSNFMIALWISWFENKEKNQVKDFKFIDTKNNKELTLEDLGNLDFGFHGPFELHERYRMMVDFHNTIKEAAPVVVKRSHGIFYGEEGRDWIAKED